MDDAPTKPAAPRASGGARTASSADPGAAALSIRLDLAPDVRVGPGKIRLLELVAEHGSISAAGRALGMSYRRAWLLLDALNRGFPDAVVDAARGGRSGGGAVLTSFGRHLVASYRAIEREAERAAAPHLASLRPAPAPARR